VRLRHILDILGSKYHAVMDPVYPVYVDTNVMAAIRARR
jgi:hypothetical protein